MDEPTIRRRNRLKHHYTTVSNVILFGYHDLTDAAKLTYQAIDSFDWPDEKGERKGCAYPSIGRLASLRGVGERTIRNHLRELEDTGLLSREFRPGRPSVLWIEEPSKEEGERYLSTITTGPETDCRGTPEISFRPYKKEESETDKTVNAERKSWKGRGRLSAEQRAKREWLAGEMLGVLHDAHSLGFYRKVAATKPEQRVFEALSEVKLASREGRVRTSKGALFTALIQHRKE